MKFVRDQIVTDFFGHFLVTVFQPAMTVDIQTDTTMKTPRGCMGLVLKVKALVTIQMVVNGT